MIENNGNFTLQLKTPPANTEVHFGTTPSDIIIYFYREKQFNWLHIKMMKYLLGWEVINK